ncbi:aldo/keto reductase [Candidatus Desulforudis audaxviator]|uniref:aldo/keto reductase n=1 Tax=Candidatus Desulforudis audaxviator TaxID=471827 RepID=UPI0002FE3503|nr:aldo/keto reductase [Candidatus Desulforudis audaxviator]
MNIMNRRRFIQLGLTVTATAGLTGCKFFLEPGKVEELPLADENEKESQEPPIPRRKLGQTGYYTSIFGLGGAFIVAQGRRNEAAAVINRALDLGVNYIDTAPTYGNSESNIGEVMRYRRNEVYLASKTLDRSRDGTMQLFEQSLKRLQTDYLDLYQLHGVHSYEDLKQLFGAQGAIKALDELREGGVVKFTGITSHKNCPVLLQALEEYDFDCVLIALNAGDVHDDSFAENVLQVARQKDMGIVAMKVAAYGRIFREGGVASMEQALGYALTYPVSTALVGVSNLEELEENVRIVRNFKPFSKNRMKQLEELTEPYQQEINFFKHQW